MDGSFSLSGFHAAFLLIVVFFGSINLAKIAGTGRQTDAYSRQIEPSHKFAPMNKGMDFAGLISGRWRVSHYIGSHILDIVVFNPGIPLSAGCLEPLILNKR